MMKGINEALRQLRDGHPVYVDCKDQELLTEPGAWKQWVHEICPVFKQIAVDGDLYDINRGTLAARAAEEVENWNSEIEALEELIADAELCRQVVRWPIRGAKDLIDDVERHSHNVEWREGGHEWSASTGIDYRGERPRWWGVYFKDNNRTTLRAVNNSLKRLIKIHENFF